MLDECRAALQRRGVPLPPPMVVADRGLSASKLRQEVGAQHQGTVLVEGKQSYPFLVAHGQRGKGSDLLHGEGWPWRQSPWEAGVSAVRLRATRPT